MPQQSQEPNGRSFSETSASTKSSDHDASPFVYRSGRAFLRDVPNYPLPVDLNELHRQTLRTTLLTEVFGRPYCAKFKKPPERILEMICGPATWSLQCDRYLKDMGFQQACFTGLDLAPLAPDLREYGVKWKFVQHDLRSLPLPFPEEYWDLIIVNDGVTVLPSGRDMGSMPIAALKKYVRPGGCVEVWESDYVFRCLQPEPAAAHGTASDDAAQAVDTATYTFGPATPFSKAQNPYLNDYNRWVEKAMRERGITVTPCALMNFGLSTEQSGYEEVGSRRVAIPFSPIRWEDDVEASRDGRTGRSVASSSGKKVGKAKGLTKSSSQIKEFKPLTVEQAALRRTALIVAVGLIESLEPILMKESGMKQDEWDRWWGNMMTDLFEKRALTTASASKLASGGPGKRAIHPESGKPEHRSSLSIAVATAQSPVPLQVVPTGDVKNRPMLETTYDEMFEEH